MNSFAKPFLILLLCFFSSYDVRALPLGEWQERLQGLGARGSIKAVAENPGDWLRLDELGAYEGENREVAKSLTVTMIEAFEQVAIQLENTEDADDLVGIAKMSAAISIAATSKGGYLNDLIAASGENVVILYSWKFLDVAPGRHSQLLEGVILPLQKEVWAKRWFNERLGLDPWLEENRERLSKLKDDTGGFQAANYLGMGRKYPEMQKPDVYKMMESPDLVTLWREIFFNNYEITAVIPAAIQFTADGGNLNPVPASMPDAVERIFGETGVPVQHQLRGGRIHAEDIWRSRSLSVDKVQRDVNIEVWFGGQ